MSNSKNTWNKFILDRTNSFQNKGNLLPMVSWHWVFEARNALKTLKVSGLNHCLSLSSLRAALATRSGGTADQEMSLMWRLVSWLSSLSAILLRMALSCWVAGCSKPQRTQPCRHSGNLSLVDIVEILCSCWPESSSCSDVFFGELTR